MATKIDLNGNDKQALKNGLMGLVLAIVEVIRDSLRSQAMRRIEGGSLTEEEIERLGKSLQDFDEAIEKMKEEHGLKQAVESVRNGLDNIASDLVNSLLREEQLKAISRGDK